MNQEDLKTLTKDQLKFLAKTAVIDEKFDEKYVSAIKESAKENLAESQKTIRHYQSWIGGLKIAGKIAFTVNMWKFFEYLTTLKVDFSFLAQFFSTLSGV